MRYQLMLLTANIDTKLYHQPGNTVEETAINGTLSAWRGVYCPPTRVRRAHTSTTSSSHPYCPLLCASFSPNDLACAEMRRASPCADLALS
jgi:hypothetical protein